MRALTPTKLSIYDFGRIVGISPLHLGQVSFTPANRSQQLCDQVYFQYAYQDADRISREDIAYAIAEAEEMVERYIRYRLIPTWEVDEWRPTDATYTGGLTHYGYHDMGGYGQVVRARWGHFISGGVEAKTLILAGDDSDIVPANWINPITFSDRDGDGYKERATVQVTVPEGTAACEIAIYYPGESGADEWEIRPIKTVISGTTATITFRREQCVLPELMEVLGPEPVDGTDDTQFLGVVDVYRHWNDPQTQATLMWEPGGGCGCGLASCGACSYSTQTACLHLRDDPRLSLIAYTPATWDADLANFTQGALGGGSFLGYNRQPDIIRMSYYSGLHDKRKPCARDMDEQWKRTIAHYACALLDRPPCDCVATEWEYWREDMSLVQGSDGTGSQKGTYSLGGAATRASDIENTFGARRGMIDAWRRVTREALAETVIA